MAEDFSKLSAQMDRAVTLINEAVDIIKNPQTDNNNQAVIDALTIRLSGAADALSGVVPAASEPAPAPAETPAPVAVEPAPVSDVAPAPADTGSGTASSDASTPLA